MSKMKFTMLTQMSRESAVETLEQFLGALDKDVEQIRKDFAFIWEKPIIETKQCPFVVEHRVSKAKYDEHVKECGLKARGINPEFSLPEPPSAVYAYEHAQTVFPLKPVLEEIPKMEIEPEYDVWSLYFPQPYESDLTFQQLQQRARVQQRQPPKNMPRNLNNMQDVVVVDERDELFSIVDKESQLPNYPYPKIKNVIWNWKKIPYRVKYLDVGYVSKERVINWIYRNVIKYTRSFSTPDDYDYLYTVILQNDPDNAVKLLQNKMGDKTTDFVVDIWKIVAFELLEMRHKYLVSTGQVADPKPIEQLVDPAKVTNEVSKGYEGLGPRDRLQQYLHDVHIAHQLHKVADVKPINLDIAPLKSRLPKEYKPKSELELLQEQRDYKRRRTKYRARNTHITKRTPTEVARDIINERMMELGAKIELTKEEQQAEKEQSQPPPPPQPRDWRDNRRDDRRFDRPYDRRDDRRGADRRDDRPPHDRPHQERPPSDRPPSDRPPSDRPPSDRAPQPPPQYPPPYPPNERPPYPPNEKPPLERLPPPERPPQERPPSDRPHDSRPSHDRSHHERRDDRRDDRKRGPPAEEKRRERERSRSPKRGRH